MKEADFTEIRQLWLATEGMGLNNIDDSKEGLSRFLIRNPATCFVFRKQNKIMGVIMTGHDGRRGFIYHLAVAKEVRFQGVGSALVQKALTALQGEEIYKVALVAFEKNQAANRFWEKQGFTQRPDLVYRNKALVAFERLDT